MREEWSGSSVLGPRVTIRRLMPSFRLFERMLTRVGEPWNWNKRASHVNRLRYWRTVMRDPRTSLYGLYLDDKEVGLCLVMQPREERRDLLSGANPTEIKWFGLQLEHTNKGLGGSYLAALFDNLFKFHDEVYLSTRSTNHARVVPFYLNMGMKIVGKDIKPDDVLHEYNPYKTAS